MFAAARSGIHLARWAMADRVLPSDDISGLWGSQADSLLSPEPMRPARGVRSEPGGAGRHLEGDGAGGISVEEKVGTDETRRLAESLRAVKAEVTALRHELAELRAAVHDRRPWPRRSPTGNGTG